MFQTVMPVLNVVARVGHAVVVSLLFQVGLELTVVQDCGTTSAGCHMTRARLPAHTLPHCIAKFPEPFRQFRHVGGDVVKVPTRWLYCAAGRAFALCSSTWVTVYPVPGSTACFPGCKCLFRDDLYPCRGCPLCPGYLVHVIVGVVEISRVPGPGNRGYLHWVDG